MREDLSPKELDDLRHELRHDIKTARRHLYELYISGHSLNSLYTQIRATTYVTRATVQGCIFAGASLPPLSHSPAPTFRPRHFDCTTVRIYPQVPTPTADMITLLQSRMSKLRGTTPLDSKLRDDSQKLDEIYFALYERGVRMSDLSDVGGVSPRTIRSRINRQREKVHGRST